MTNPKEATREALPEPLKVVAWLTDRDLRYLAERLRKSVSAFPYKVNDDERAVVLLTDAQSALESERQAHAAEVAALKLQLEAGPLYSTRLKAKRYDWLREQAEPNRGGEKPWCTVRDGKGYAWAMGGALDAAIDAAIAKDKPA